ncbi:transmembrane protein 87A [Ixodes scapularis]|uniref:transmembrane protein 87A n=1 Tax=Ixodes scapularis TaxID=6945 RepID=UPI001A9FABD5|nr:transmembrane protein 87A [Ixodes scapularis]
MVFPLESLCACLLVLAIVPSSSAFPDQGKWSFKVENVPKHLFAVQKSLYRASTVSIKITCDPSNPASANMNVLVGWTLLKSPCFQEFLDIETLTQDTLSKLYTGLKIFDYGDVYYKSSEELHPCFHVLDLSPHSLIKQMTNTTTATKSKPFTRASTLDSELQSYPSPASLSTAVQNPHLKYALYLILCAKRGAQGEKGSPGCQECRCDEVNDKDASSANRYNQMSRTPFSCRLGRSRSDCSNLYARCDSVASVLRNEMGKQCACVSVQNLVYFFVLDRAPENVTDVLDPENLKKILASDPRPLAILDKDGIYMLIVSISSEDEKNFTVQVDMSLKGTYGYLSAVDWPFLPFYGVMCGVYVLYAVGWLLVSALQWRDLLRIQFWIGGVISLGMLEKAVYYAEYQSINYTGYSVQGAVLFAEVLSCLKRSLARLLVIIVSLGFGIVKPRLGAMLHRVIIVGGAYFIMASVEGCLRTLKPKNNPDHLQTFLGVGLALVDSGICWWIFSSLSQTTRTLRLRRNVVKLSLYRHFTNTLIFAVLASIVFMVWVTFDHRTVECLTDWKELWFDEGYWQLLFSVVLLVIMFLWRPTNNNQRYAFTPLLDAADDEFDEDFQQPANDAFEGMKMRGGKPGSLPSKDKQDNNSAEDDLKWVEETIPSSLSDTALPSLMDSDEEIMTVRFERNKME